MAKEKSKAGANTTQEQTAQEAAPAAASDGGKGGGGAAIVLPNGERRIDFIRDHYYGANGKEKLSRSQIKDAINKMYADAGQEDTKIAYQIVFSATKSKTDPRVKAPEAAPAGSGNTQETASA
jgi:hypothetical protein